MRIGFDAKRLFYNNTGLGNYSRTLVNNLLRFEQDVKAELFVPQGNSAFHSYYEEHENCSINTLNKPWGNIRRTLGFSKEIRESNIDIYHGLSNELPLNIHRIPKVKKVVTMHDLIYRTFPKDFTKIDRSIYHYKSVKACQMADRVIAISKATKKDLINILGVDESRIDVLYQSCHPIFQEKERLSLPIDSLPNDYLLYVGTVNKRKNLIGILKALSFIPKDQRIPLVVVGKGSDSYMAEIKSNIKELKIEKEVHFMGAVKNESLKAFYQHARCTILPSFYEGFGIPIIESLFCSTPVITSNVTSLPEAAGDCGILVDPTDIDEIAHAIQKITQDEELFNGLKKRIPGHIKTFSSQDTTKELMKCYRKVL